MVQNLSGDLIRVRMMKTAEFVSTNPAAIAIELEEVSLAGAAVPGAITEVSATAVGIF